MYVPTPAQPALPDDQRREDDVPLRFEDIAQDGRLMVGALGPLYGAVAWKGLIDQGPMAEAARAQGMLPILTRLVMTGGGGPFRPDRPLRVAGAYDLAHSVDEAGEVARLHLRIWARARGLTGHAYDLLAASGDEQEAGHVYAEHVFTRPFAAPHERRVRSLDLPGLPPLPDTRHEPVAGRDLLGVPPDAIRLGPDCETTFHFSLGHTDSNQHVNSLVYPRLFEEAALRQLHAVGRPVDRLVRHADCFYRKPFFAGDEALVSLSLWAVSAGTLVTGTFHAAPHGIVLPEPNVYVRMMLLD